MHRQDKIRENNIKNLWCYYTDDIINIKNLALDKVLAYERSYQKNLSIQHVACKTHTMKSPCVLVLIRYTDILKSMGEIDMHHYSIITKNMKERLIESSILLVKKVIFQIFIITTSWNSGLIHMMVYLLKKT